VRDESSGGAEAHAGHTRGGSAAFSRSSAHATPGNDFLSFALSFSISSSDIVMPVSA
jgi:hypothetical protein